MSSKRKIIATLVAVCFLAIVVSPAFSKEFEPRSLKSTEVIADSPLLSSTTPRQHPPDCGDNQTQTPDDQGRSSCCFYQIKPEAIRNRRRLYREISGIDASIDESEFDAAFDLNFSPNILSLPTRIFRKIVMQDDDCYYLEIR